MPICPPKPPPPPPPSLTPPETSTGPCAAGRGGKGGSSYGPIPTIPCILCDSTLYENGTLHDIHDKINYIKQESLLKNDDIAKKIGIGTKITIHKNCYEEYIKHESKL